MKAASIAEIKQELKTLPANDLLELCLRLAKSKKDNKEFLNYLLFESHDVDSYIREMKAEIDEQLSAVNKQQLYLLKKQLRKLLSWTNKHLKFTASKVAEAEVLIYFCQNLKKREIPYKRTTALMNIYQAQIKKIATAIGTLHEDLQHDFIRQLESLK